MILDVLNKVASALAATTATPGQFSIDLDDPVPARRVGTGEPMSLMFVVKVAAVGNGTFDLIQSDNADLSSPDAVVTRVVLAADLKLGALVDVPIPTGTTSKRYLGGRVAAGTSITVDAYVLPQSHLQDFRSYAKNYAV